MVTAGISTILQLVLDTVLTQLATNNKLTYGNYHELRRVVLAGSSINNNGTVHTNVNRLNNSTFHSSIIQFTHMWRIQPYTLHPVVKQQDYQIPRSNTAFH